MPRIVAGSAKGRHLAVPAKGTRPTSDRAREALFSSLASMVDLHGARVLDLFAGTGAVGLEALSRGAAQVTFVESDRAAAEVLKHNIAAVGLAGTALLRCTAESFVIAAGAEAPFRLAFADPPYALRDAALAAILAALDDPRWLEPGAIVVVERAARSAEPQWPDGVAPVKQRRYGEGVLWYGRRR